MNAFSKAKARVGVNAHVHFRRVASLLGAVLVLWGNTPAAAQVPSNPFDYTRTTQFTYFTAADGAKNGQVKTVTQEPTNAPSCAVTTYDYDPYGNKVSTSVSNCGSAPTSALFAARGSSLTYAALPSQSVTLGDLSAQSTTTVSVQPGLFPTVATNALSRTESRQFDPRYGVATQVSDDPNGLIIKTVVDDFGRVVQEVRADGTSVVSLYCVLGSSGLDTSGNSVACPTPIAAEAPSVAVMFVQTEPHDSSSAVGTKMGAFTRTYTDRLGRVVRVVTEGFDGPDQPANLRGSLVVKDIVYDANGAKAMETQPYFLASGSSTTGANDVGVTAYAFDVLGRPAAVYKVDPNATGFHTFGQSSSFGYGAYGGSRYASSTTYSYAGLTATIFNDKSQPRTEEKNANGQVARVTDASGAQLAFLRDAFGNLVQTTDALQNSILVQYDFAGRKIQLNDPDKGVLGYCYDALGQVKALQTSNMRGSNTPGVCPSDTGTTTAAVKYTGWTTYAYDKLGRLTQRIEPESTSTWGYDTYIDKTACNKGIGRLCETQTDTWLDRKFSYDSYGRPLSNRLDVSGGPTIANAVGYDPVTGRLASTTYPTGVQVGYGYSTAGYLQSVQLNTTTTINPLPNAQGATASGATLTANTSSAVLWKAQWIDAWGEVEKSALGNGLSSTKVPEPATGRLASLTVGNGGSLLALSQQYNWDTLGNLTGRADTIGDGNGNAVSETFVYGDNPDPTKNINRLTQYTVSSTAMPGLARQVSLTYNALGLLLSKSDVGNYSYGAAGSARPHAVQGVSGSVTSSFGTDLDGNITSATGGKYRSLGYTSFDMPSGQTGISGPSGTPAYTWQYDESHQRVKETRVDASGTRVVWYSHPDNVGGLGFEREEGPGGVSNRHFLNADGKPIGVLVTTGALATPPAGQTAPTAIANTGAVKLEYWHQDHLGSIAATTDHWGNVTARYAYDPFGKRRDGTGAYDANGAIVVDWDPAHNAGTGRGFTGHEELDDIGLVNMNGRVFDPMLGLFVQADPHVTDPGNLQSYNRYAYVLNNPLNATDPSGYEVAGDPAGTSDAPSIADAPQKITVTGHAAGQDPAGSTLVGNGPGQKTTVPTTAATSTFNQPWWGRVKSARDLYHACGTDKGCTETQLKALEALYQELRGDGISSFESDMMGLKADIAQAQFYLTGNFGGAMEATGVVGIASLAQGKTSAAEEREIQSILIVKSREGTDLAAKTLAPSSWSAARPWYWKQTPLGRAPKREVLIRRNKTGNIERKEETKELHHKVAQRDKGSHEKENLVEVWPTEHGEIDPDRKPGYTVLKVLRGPY